MELAQWDEQVPLEPASASYESLDESPAKEIGRARASDG
jgi:hypothetical protein